MNVKSVEKEATRASVTVELTREELEPALNRAYLKYRKDIMIPGFRKGHAPRMVIEAAYGKHVFFEDAVEDMFPDIYKDAVLTQDIRPVGRPSVSKMDIADDGAVTLTRPRSRSRSPRSRPSWTAWPRTLPASPRSTARHRRGTPP